MKRILYFTDDFSQENQAHAKQHGLIIRNSLAYGDVDFVERCDMVCGNVPQAYQHLPVFELPKLGDDEKPKPKPRAKTEKEPTDA